jgi:galactonate dehydratase
MAAAHVCATMPNFQILEFAFGETTWRHELIDPPEQMEKGVLTVSSRPGFGIELNDRAVAAHRAA